MCGFEYPHMMWLAAKCIVCVSWCMHTLQEWLCQRYLHQKSCFGLSLLHTVSHAL